MKKGKKDNTKYNYSTVILLSVLIIASILVFMTLAILKTRNVISKSTEAGISIGAILEDREEILQR